MLYQIRSLRNHLSHGGLQTRSEGLTGLYPKSRPGTGKLPTSLASRCLKLFMMPTDLMTRMEILSILMSSIRNSKYPNAL